MKLYSLAAAIVTAAGAFLVAPAESAAQHRSGVGLSIGIGNLRFSYSDRGYGGFGGYGGHGGYGYPRTIYPAPIYAAPIYTAPLYSAPIYSGYPRFRNDFGPGYRPYGGSYYGPRGGYINPPRYQYFR